MSSYQLKFYGIAYLRADMHIISFLIISALSWVALRSFWPKYLRRCYQVIEIENMVQGSCFYFISQRENGEENQKGKVTYLGLLNMNWFSWYYQWVWLVAFKWYLEKCNLHLTCKDTWTTCSRMHGSFILRSAGFRIRHLILAWVLSGAISTHPWYPHLSIWT